MHEISLLSCRRATASWQLITTTFLGHLLLHFNRILDARDGCTNISPPPMADSWHLIIQSSLPLQCPSISAVRCMPIEGVFINENELVRAIFESHAIYISHPFVLVSLQRSLCYLYRSEMITW
ncbi:hypothetical protein PILCRDRAFT_331213 [Piloderma croceum F 1598]|uniref:Uncharacterized protein n=1 Tax=Piloderma croceum (strain F 1598) TaxID=765440 RepID=A0A0C3C8H4_PILCF|nr:hypothetical protein PILCRDRAFT_331213 [Piloderma croceum F 1598]